MVKYAVAGVGAVKALDSTGNIIFTSKTLTDSGFNASTTLEEIRGGFGNALQAQYAHTSALTVTMKDSLVDLTYLSLQVGGTITTGGSAFADETVTTTVQNQISVTGSPIAYGNYGIIGWYTVQGASNTTPTKITFTGKTATVTNLAVGTTVCVTYIITDSAAKVFEVASTFIPSIVHLVMTIPLLQAGSTSTLSNSSQVGEWDVDIPKFQLNGTIDMSTTSAGVASGDISGKALASGATTCSGTAIYATITQNIYNAGVFDNVKSIAVVDSDVDLIVNGKQTLEVMAIENDGTTFVVDNSLLTFTSAAIATATVTGAGLVNGVAVGNTDIEVVVTGKTALTAYAHVTVKAS